MIIENNILVPSNYFKNHPVDNSDDSSNDVSMHEYFVLGFGKFLSVLFIYYLRIFSIFIKIKNHVNIKCNY